MGNLFPNTFNSFGRARFKQDHHDVDLSIIYYLESIWLGILEITVDNLLVKPGQLGTGFTPKSELIHVTTRCLIKFFFIFKSGLYAPCPMQPLLS